MIQRVQTLYMLAGVVLAVVLLFIPIAGFTLGSGEQFSYSLTDYPSFVGSGVDRGVLLTPLVATLLVAVVLLITIFLYRNRRLQRKLLLVSVVINLSTLGGVFYASDQISQLSRVVSEKAAYSLGAYIPLLILVFIVLANNGIRKDEKLIKSADRIR